jgi:hypothetical protein
MADQSLQPSPCSPNFQHRYNQDGTCDSICLRCYRTVASSREEQWLAYQESVHTCALMDLHEWNVGS